MSTIPDNGPTFITPRQPKWITDQGRRIDLKALKARVLVEVAPRPQWAVMPAAFVPVAERELAALIELAEAAEDFGGEMDHAHSCKFRTKEAGWTPGDPPVIRCHCGLARLEEALSRMSFDA